MGSSEVGKQHREKIRKSDRLPAEGRISSDKRPSTFLRNRRGGEGNGGVGNKLLANNWNGGSYLVVTAISR